MVEKTENRVKIGAKVPESVYAEFTEFVYEKTGQKRGVLGEAVEAALVEYMDDTSATVSGDVSNEDLLREIRSLQHSDETPAPTPRSGTNESDGASVGTDERSVASDPSSTGETPAPPPGDDKGTLEDDTGESSDDGKPPLNAPPGERVEWLSSILDMSGKVPLSNLVNLVGKEYPGLSSSKCRDLAWELASAHKPKTGDVPEDIDKDVCDAIKSDSKLQSRASENNPDLYYFPRSHSNGAWFQVDEEGSNGALNHQEPTERGDVSVFLGRGGAVAVAKSFGWLPSDYTTPSGVNDEEYKSDSPLRHWDGGRRASSHPNYTEESTDSESEEESTEESSDDVDIPGSKDGDSTFEEMEDADRGSE